MGTLYSLTAALVVCLTVCVLSCPDITFCTAATIKAFS